MNASSKEPSAKAPKVKAIEKSAGVYDPHFPRRRPTAEEMVTDNRSAETFFPYFPVRIR